MTVSIMADDARTSAGGWTRRHTWMLVAALTVAILVLPFAVGVIEGYRGSGDGTMQQWLKIALILAVIAVMGTAAWAAWRKSTAIATGPGEAKVARNSRTFWTILGALFLSGFVVGLLAALYEQPTDGGFMTGTFPPWFAMVTAIGTLLAMTVGSWIFFRRIDEFERQDNLVAAAYGANFVMIGYPVWFILWKGGWVPEPHHLIVAGALFIVMTATYLIRKFR